MRLAIGIDIGGTNIRVASVTDQGKIIVIRKSLTPQTDEDIIAAIKHMIGLVDADHKAVAIGIGVPARVDVANGQIFPGGFVDLSLSNLVSRMKMKFGNTIFIDNDASMALLAEARMGSAKGISNVILLTIGTGIGGALMAGGKIFHGRATAGQLGHMTVDINGLICQCGRVGCVETTSSGTALRRLLDAAGLPQNTLITDLLNSEDKVEKSILRAWALPLRSAIDSLVAAFDPELVVLGGGLGAAAVQALADFPVQSDWFQYNVVKARLGDDAGVIGSALASLEAAP